MHAVSIKILKFPLKRKTEIKGSYRHITKALPVAANKTANPRYTYANNLSPFSSHFGKVTGYKTTKSCIAPRGHTAAQNVLPKNSVNTSGSRKNTATTTGTA